MVSLTSSHLGNPEKPTLGRSEQQPPVLGAQARQNTLDEHGNGPILRTEYRQLISHPFGKGKAGAPIGTIYVRNPYCMRIYSVHPYCAEGKLLASLFFFHKCGNIPPTPYSVHHAWLFKVLAAMC